MLLYFIRLTYYKYFTFELYRTLYYIYNANKKDDKDSENFNFGRL